MNTGPFVLDAFFKLWLFFTTGSLPPGVQPLSLAESWPVFLLLAALLALFFCLIKFALHKPMRTALIGAFTSVLVLCAAVPLLLTAPILWGSMHVGLLVSLAILAFFGLCLLISTVLHISFYWIFVRLLLFVCLCLLGYCAYYWSLYPGGWSGVLIPMMMVVCVGITLFLICIATIIHRVIASLNKKQAKSEP